MIFSIVVLSQDRNPLAPTLIYPTYRISTCTPKYNALEAKWGCSIFSTQNNCFNTGSAPISHPYSFVFHIIYAYTFVNHNNSNYNSLVVNHTQIQNN